MKFPRRSRSQLTHGAFLRALVNPGPIFLLLLFVSISTAQAQTTVRGRIELGGARRSRKSATPTTVVWLTPLNGAGDVRKPDPASGFRLVQKNKSFDPHVLVVPVGSQVEFPNHDP